MPDNQEQNEPSVEPTLVELIPTGVYKPAYHIVLKIVNGSIQEERVPVYTKDGVILMEEIIEKRVIKPDS